MQSVIKLSNLTKSYGKSRGINDISLKVEQGSVFGFLGPNGAGKTTTISILVDIIRPSSGSAQIFGQDTRLNGLEIRNKIGFLYGDMAFDNSLTGWQQLEYFGKLRNKFDKKYITKLAKDLDCDLTKKFKELSRGNKQKIGLISALMHKPKLLILDEPTSGLDPLIQEQFNEIILAHKKAGNTTFISSHILSEVQELCDNVAFIKEGKLIANEPITSITKNAPYIIEITVKDNKIKDNLKQLPNVSNISLKNNQITFSYNGSIKKLLNLLGKYELSDIQIKKADLESIFMQYYKD